MARTKRSKINLSMGTASSAEKRRSPNYLPPEIWEMIISRLSLRENVVASTVSKKWLYIATSCRPTKPPMWLLSIPEAGDDSYEFYNPLENKSYNHKLPELEKSTILYYKDGWLLMHRHDDDTDLLFFFCPYTRESLSLPPLPIVPHQRVAFSSAPSSSDCVIFTVALSNDSVSAISTCNPRATQWNTTDYTNNLPFNAQSVNRLIFSKVVFYCLDSLGRLGSYNHESGSWRIMHANAPRCPHNHDTSCDTWFRGNFMAEHNGDILVLYSCPRVNPMLYRLDQVNEVWVRMQKHDEGITFFASCLYSHVITDLLGEMRNAVCFPQVQRDGEACLTYSLVRNKYSYYTILHGYNWGKIEPDRSIWIEAPKDLSMFN